MLTEISDRLKVRPLVSLAICTVLHLLASAQQPTSPVLTIPLVTSSVQIVPVDSASFLVLDLSGPQLNPNQLGLEIHNYDTSLRPQWKNTIPITRGLQLQYFQIDNDQFFLVFQDANQKMLEIFSVHLGSGHFKRSQFAFSNRLQLEKLVSWNDHLWASGLMSGQGVVFSLDRSKNQYQILPTAYAHRVSAVRELHVNPSKDQLGFFLLTEVEGLQSYVLRTMDIKSNRVIRDQPIRPADNLQLGQIRKFQLMNQPAIVGTYFRRDPLKSEGLFLMTYNENQFVEEKYYSFKDIPEFSEFIFWPDGESEPKLRSQKGQVKVSLDHIEPLKDELLISLEVLEKSYKAKGALQQEFERSQMVNSLDQDQYGRRSFDQSTEGESVGDRIEKRSATDIIQYRYRNAIVAQPTYQGLTYDRSVLITLDQNLDLTRCKGIKTGKQDFAYLGTSNTVLTDHGVRQFYDRGGTYYTWLYQPETEQFRDLSSINYSDSPSRAWRIAKDKFLVMELNKEAAGYLLKLQIKTL